eukprot:TRINITY_DN6316_c0_g1_i2.p2 TRINITY_DN6316_c0_g1~~TRINITY_DN6316_c0_g1_i2.p2  ORF type:complete len:215 (+),score=64.50 TRINITY_DN6316_c0_g1_i2:51-695(+)
MSRAVVLFIAATAILCAAQSASALTFDVSVGTAKCFKEEMSKNQLVTGTYQVPTSNVLMMRFWVEDPLKNAVVDYADAQTGKYAFTADVDGDYKFCFQDVPRPGAYINWSATQPRRVILTMHLDEETQASKSALALKDKLQPLEAELVRIEATAYEVKLGAEHGREREAAHRDQSEAINSRVAWLSMFTIISVVCLGLWQIWAQRNFLKKKKII